MKKKSIVIVILLMISLLLVSCNSKKNVASTTGKNSNTVTQSNMPNKSDGMNTDNGKPTESSSTPVNNDNNPVNEVEANAIEISNYAAESFPSMNGTYSGTDDLGRILPMPGTAPSPKERYVGIFFFLWQGQHGTTGPYDNTKIMSSDPKAMLNESKWGPVGAHHFWGEPLFGYYTSDDTWVMRKQVQMLTDANVDFLVFDTTNAYTYTAQTLKLMAILNEYQLAGWKVPKVSFYTNSSSGATITSIYKSIYKAHPEYKDLWFNWEGKPLIIGVTTDSAISAEAKSFFRIKSSQWPTEGEKFDGFPWMSFKRPQAVFKNSKGEKEVMNVSIAQHPNIRFSQSAFYNKSLTGSSVNWTRSYHNGSNDLSAGAVNYGYNFKEQWEYAIKQDPKMIFITGWNEWVAQRQPGDANEPIVFIDCANANNSRDAEPMKGGFGDNYYIQMMNYIRLYKGTPALVNANDKKTINISGKFSQWDSVKAFYRDYKNDIVNRKSVGFGKIQYNNETGRNDIDIVRVTSDETNIYFYIKTIDNISPSSGSKWMNLFINTGNSSSNWYGYDFIVNRVAPSGNKAILEKCTGGWNWQEAAKIDFRVSGNQMHLAIPRSVLGMSDKNINIQFKVADNYQGEGDIFSFYSDGDVAPYGRLNYVFAQ